MFTIQVSHFVYSYIPKKIYFNYWINAVFKECAQKGDITIRIVDVIEIQRLNFIYRNKNYPTNIISFPFENTFKIKISFLGDLVICSQILEYEAKKEKKNLLFHWAHIVIHGCLHLLGFDHVQNKDAEIMEKKESKIMLNVGYYLLK